MHTRNPFTKHSKLHNIIEMFGKNKLYWVFPIELKGIEGGDNVPYGKFENEIRL